MTGNLVGMGDCGGDVFGCAVALHLAWEEQKTDVGGASGQDVEHVLNDGAGGGGDERDGCWDGGNAAFTFASEESLGFEAAFEGFELCVEQSLATCADAVDAQLVGASGLVERDDPIDFDGHAFREGNVWTKPNATDCGVGIFECEVNCARLAFDAADLAGDEHLSDLLLEGLEDALVELRDSDGVPGGHAGILRLRLSAGE